MNLEVFQDFCLNMQEILLEQKMLGTVSVLLRGIPFIYQGQEIGMQNAVWNDVKEYNDINTIDQYNLAISAGLSDKEAWLYVAK